MADKNVGRPRKFESVEELQEMILEYYEHCEEKDKPMTIAGLAVWLDVDRQTIYNYEQKDEFFGTIKRARDYILASLEERLMVDGRAGQIFLAKNYGYTDKQEIDSTVKQTNVNIDASSMSDDQIVEELRKAREEIDRVLGE